MTKQGIKQLFGRYINEHKRKSKEAAVGWGLDDLVFANELEEIRDKILGEIPRLDKE